MLWKKAYYVMCTYMAHAVAFAAIRMTKTQEHFAESSYTTQLRVQTMHNTWIVLPVASTIARAEICLGCWRDHPFLNRTHLVFDEVIPMGSQPSRQHDQTPTKIASALENFPAIVIMPSVWPDWSKFQFLRSWHDLAKIRTTRTTTYQTWSERSNHSATRPVCNVMCTGLF